MECILHIAYRINIKIWKVSSKSGDKSIIEEQKKKIQKDYREKAGLLLDIPKQGFGTTNDGNTARRFFSDPQLASQITKVDENLINRYATISNVLACGFEINYMTFEQFCTETAEYYVRLYPWYYMPPTVHKVLVHGSRKAKFAILPIGQLSEEALEARNKDVRNFWLNHTRKFCRTTTNRDLFQRLLSTSDPVICSTYHYKFKKNHLPEEMKNLIISEGYNNSETSSDKDDDNN